MLGTLQALRLRNEGFSGVTAFHFRSGGFRVFGVLTFISSFRFGVLRFRALGLVHVVSVGP